MEQQPGFFDLNDREAPLERLGDPLPKLDQVVDWKGFRAELAKIRDKPRQSKAGRKLFDSVLMFKVLVLQHLYNLSDDQTEYQIRDRYSFCRFLGLSPEGRVPDAKTIWVFREQLTQRGLIEPLFAEFALQIELAGYQSRKGQIVDASIVAAPKQRNRREENAQIKACERRPKTGLRTSAGRKMSRRVGPRKTARATTGTRTTSTPTERTS